MFLSRRYRPNKWPFFGLIALEFGLTIGLLTMVGIAAPNTYRTKLWQDGADNGFNSSPVTGLYAAANYRPYTTPEVWTQFITNYNIVVVVLSMFLMLTKGTMYILHVFPPILSTLVHAALIVLYTVSVYYQASSDNSDPEHPSNGPVWYITKSCSVTRNKKLVGYCKQAKATFALSCAMLGLFVVYLIIAVWSCIPSAIQKQEYRERKRARDEKWSKLEAIHEEAKREGRIEGMVPETPGLQSGMNPVTPRTMAFNTLGGTKDLPLRNQEMPLRHQEVQRNHFSSPNAPTSPTYNLRSPGLPRSPLSMGFKRESKAESERDEIISANAGASAGAGGPQMFFPPPPKSSKKSKK